MKMSNATKSLAAIFIILLAVTGLVKWTGDPSSSRAFSKRLVSVDSSDVNKIIIRDRLENRTIILTKSGRNWQVSGSTEETAYAADASAVKRAIEQLNKMSVEAVASRDPQKYSRYKVDSTGTKVTLFAGDSELASLFVGAPRMENRNSFSSYVRPEGDQAVYAVDAFLGPTFSRDISGWRDKRIWDIEEKKISRISLRFPADSSYTVHRAGESSWVSEGDTLQASALSMILTRLGSLRADGFADSLSVGGFGDGLYSIVLQLDDGTQKKLRLKLPSSEKSHFYAAADGYPYVFTLDRSSFKNAVLKGRSELLAD